MRALKIYSALFCSFLALASISLIILGVHESPWGVFQILAKSSLGNWQEFSSTLFYATPLFLTGLAVLIPYKAGLFNIGAEGQLYMGAVGAIIWGNFATDHILMQNSSIPAQVLVLLGGFCISALCGAAYSAIAGALKVYRGVHEVISTIMLNFISMATCNWFILNIAKNPETQSVETKWIHESVRLPRVSQNLPWSFFIALALAVLVIYSIKKLSLGYRVRASGLNANAARIAGISVPETLLSAMTFGGAMAGLVGFHEIYFSSYRLMDSFSPLLGFTGIAISMMSGGSLPGFMLSTFFFAALHKGTLDLDLETDHITRDISFLIQAIFLIAVAVYPQITERLKAFKQRVGK